MDFSKFVLLETETKDLSKKFQPLCKEIEEAIADVDKYLTDEKVIESGNMNIIGALNTVKANLTDTCKNIQALVQIVTPVQTPEEVEVK